MKENKKKKEEEDEHKKKEEEQQEYNHLVLPSDDNFDDDLSKIVVNTNNNNNNINNNHNNSGGGGGYPNLYELFVKHLGRQITTQEFYNKFNSHLSSISNSLGVLHFDKKWLDKILIEKSKVWDVRSHCHGKKTRSKKIIGLTSSQNQIEGQAFLKKIRPMNKNELKLSKNQQKHQIIDQTDIIQFIDTPEKLWVFEFDPDSVIKYPQPLISDKIKGQVWSIVKLSSIKLNSKTNCSVSFYKASDGISQPQVPPAHTPPPLPLPLPLALPRPLPVCVAPSLPHHPPPPPGCSAARVRCLGPSPPPLPPPPPNPSPPNPSPPALLPLYLQSRLITKIHGPESSSLQSQQGPFSNDCLGLQTRLKFNQILSYELINELAQILVELLNQILSDGDDDDEDVDLPINWTDVYTKLYLITKAIPLIPKTPEIPIEISKWKYISPADWNKNNKFSWCQILHTFVTSRIKIIEQITDNVAIKDKFHSLFDAFKSEYDLHDKIEEYMSPTVPDVPLDQADSRIKQANISTKWSRAKCPSCFDDLSNIATQAPIRCAICALLHNRHCPDCVAAAGSIQNVPIGPQCQEKLLNIANFNLKDVEAIYNDPTCKLQISLSLQGNCATEQEKKERGGFDDDLDLIQFIPKQEITKRVYAKGVLVQDRFVAVPRQQLEKVLGKDNYSNLLKQWRERNKNVQYIDYTVNIKKGIQEYFELCKKRVNRYNLNCSITSNWKYKYNQKYPAYGKQNGDYIFKISSIGHLRFNGHVVAPELLKHLSDIDDDDSIKYLIQCYQQIFPPKQKFKDNEIAMKWCHSMLFKEDNKSKILSEGMSYKGGKTCHEGAIHSEEVSTNILNNETNGLHNYFHSDKIQKLKSFDWNQTKPKNNNIQSKEKFLKQEAQKTFGKLQLKNQLKVVNTSNDVEFREYMNRKFPQWYDSLNNMKLLANILNFIIATQIPQLYPAYSEHLQLNQDLELRDVDGQHYRNNDNIVYHPGAEVKPHIDTKQLIQRFIKHFGVYIVFKLWIEGLGGESTQILCSVSGKNRQCQWSRKNLGDRHSGGHINLPPATVYWMFDEGAYGGITHALHGPRFDSHTELWGGFIEESYTLVMRPLFLNFNKPLSLNLTKTKRQKKRKKKKKDKIKESKGKKAKRKKRKAKITPNIEEQEEEEEAKKYELMVYHAVNHDGYDQLDLGEWDYEQDSSSCSVSCFELDELCQSD